MYAKDLIKLYNAVTGEDLNASACSACKRNDTLGEYSGISHLPDGFLLKDLVVVIYVVNGQPIHITIPILEDETLYGEWMDRSIEQHCVEGATLDYKEYWTVEPIASDLFNIHRCKKCIEYVQANSLEQCFVTNKKVNYHYFDKTNMGVNLMPNKKGFLKGVVVQPADMFLHPGNKSIHCPEILFPTPADAYWGEKLYYDSTFPEEILINVENKWLWTNLKGIINNTPPSLVEELNLVLSVYT